MKIIKGGVTKPIGFKANGLYCGIKKSVKPDLGLIFSEVPAITAAVYTKNSVKAAPLLVCQKHLRNQKAQAIIVNSGNANCYTGDQGLKDAFRMTECVAEKLDLKTSDVLVASTGIIGRPLQIDKIEQASQQLVTGLSSKGADLFEQAILTTDLITKNKTVEIEISGRKVVVAGCGKGSGMIAPNMATMLGFITTDVAIEPKLLKLALQRATDQSFNSITVDGCMSTNDMCVVMANGMAGNPLISKEDVNFKKFSEALNDVCLDIAKKIVLDGEGATKFITVIVEGAKNEKQARMIGLTIANNNLVKTAAYGSNPNWGRVGAAVGALGLKGVDEKTMQIKFSPFDKKEISIKVVLQLGKSSAVIYTSDLSKEYVRINGEYN